MNHSGWSLIAWLTWLRTGAGSARDPWTRSTGHAGRTLLLLHRRLLLALLLLHVQEDVLLKLLRAAGAALRLVQLHRHHVRLDVLVVVVHVMRRDFVALRQQ